MDLTVLQTEYERELERLDRFARELRAQLIELFQGAQVVLAVPLESRVKSWPSIAEKAERRGLQLSSILDFHDLVGLRAIFLFKRDLEKAARLVSQTFVVTAREDAGVRLADTAFGYQSFHLRITTPPHWASLPSLRGCDGLSAELQLRTLAQHMWATASHTLQYKKEASVPSAIRRAIYRASALLETVDLEFERVLLERDEYLAIDIPEDSSEELNVDNMQTMLDQRLPSANRAATDAYDELLSELLHAGISTVAALRRIIDRRLPQALKEDQEYVRQFNRREKGAYFTYVGLVRQMCDLELGVGWR